MKKLTAVIVIFVVAIVLSAYLFSNFSLIGKAIKNSKSSGMLQDVVVTRENLPLYLQNIEIVKELPKDASILLKLYSIDSGQRRWEESYVIGKGKVLRGTVENVDAIIVIDSKYVSGLGNFCQTLQKALNNREAGFELKQGKAALLWKYRGVLKYKSCFGW